MIRRFALSLLVLACIATPGCAEKQKGGTETAKHDPVAQEDRASGTATAKSDSAVLEDRALDYYMSAHRDPESDSQQQGVDHQQKSKRQALVITWFLDKRTALLYIVSQEGEWHSVCDVYDWAFEDAQQGQLADKNLADLRELLPKLPKSAEKPPIDRTVVVSFERDGKWCTETYNSAKLPETFEKVMLIVGERHETKEQKREPTDKASP